METSRKFDRDAAGETRKERFCLCRNWFRPAPFCRSDIFAEHPARKQRVLFGIFGDGFTFELSEISNAELLIKYAAVCFSSFRQRIFRINFKLTIEPGL
jgi:hypothetical protein